jgi:hypothetical protein
LYSLFKTFIMYKYYRDDYFELKTVLITMTTYIKYLSYPPIPQRLVKPIDEIIDLVDKTSSIIPHDYTDVFNTRYVGPELHKWLETVFNFQFLAQYQIIKNGIPIHKDKANRLIAYNYLLATGGSNVITSVYDNNKVLLQAECLELHRWHRLKTGYFHGVEGIEDTRVSLSITPYNGAG